MKLIFAIGNPGDRYTDTRHNLGFTIIDAYTERKNATFSLKTKFFAEIAEFTGGRHKIILAKPTTFYNDCGSSFRAIIDFYKIAPQDALVVHDELAITFGTLRIRHGGSDAGSNGIKSINQHGGEDSMRLRIGVNNPDRLLSDTDFVLGRFNALEQKVLTDHIAPAAHEIIDSFISGGIAVTSMSVLPSEKIDKKKDN